jgi:hypothetical protein
MQSKQAALEPVCYGQEDNGAAYGSNSATQLPFLMTPQADIAKTAPTANNQHACTPAISKHSQQVRAAGVTPRAVCQDNTS